MERRDFSLGDLVRHTLFEINEERLGELAFNGIRRGMNPQEFFVVCIDVDDPTWREVVDALMPGHNWQQYRDRGEKPIARGLAAGGLGDYLGELVPAIAPSLATPLPRGAARAVVMAAGGASVYQIQPRPQKRPK